MVGSLVLSMVSALAGKAGDKLVERVAGMWGIDGIRSKLERQLLALQYKLLDAELKSETNEFVKRWMKDLRAVAYEADDVLDDFQYEALHREAQIGESTTRESKMDRVRRIAGIGKAKVPSAVQKDKDESIVFFRELYKRDKDRDVNLLEPMYSVDFDNIQGEIFGPCRPFPMNGGVPMNVVRNVWYS